MPSRTGWTIGCAALAVAVAAGAAAGQSVTADFGTTRSNTLYEDPSGETSGGSSQWIFAGLTNQPLLRRGLLTFDVSSIPAGATVTGVTLTLHMSRTATGNEPVSVHRVLSDWGSGASEPFEPGGFGAPAESGDATWLNTFYVPGGGGPTWTSPGGDFEADSLASTVVGGVGFYTWSSEAMIADVQRWLSGGIGGGPDENFGWMLLGNEGALQSVKRFDSALNGDETLRPRLTVTYLIPSPCAAGLGGCWLMTIVMGGRRRR